MTKYADWIGGEEIKFTICKLQPQPSTSFRDTEKVGRPKKPFEQSSYKTKKRRVADLVETRSLPELTTAVEVALRVSGHRKAAGVVKNLSENTEDNKVLQSVHNERLLTSDEALAYYIDAKLTSHAYKQTRKWTLRSGHKVFPSYYSVRKSKIACHPDEDQIFISETRAEIKLQAILDLTAKRLANVQSDVFVNLLPTSSFILISKWGCDGSSGHSIYKQKFNDSNDTDEFLFVFSFVPIQLRNDDNIIWQNPRPSSTMHCRPIKFIFSKESTEFTVLETDKIKKEIDQLIPTLCIINNQEISITHKLLLTMVDGKICNALTETRSSQKCYICGATPKSMNDEATKLPSNEDHFGFGLSTLHAWIRSFECLLHISYKINVKKWQVTDAQEKAVVKQRKLDLQEKFKREMGLIVDKPKPGFGSTNDGNTARRFFQNSELSAKITGLDVTLIKNLSTLLRALSSGYDINLIAFKKLADETRKIYLNKYSWYYMPVTLHKIQIHSVDVIEKSIVPIGQLSEEAQEARNKDCRKFRERYTRKKSRLCTNKDLLSMLLVTSDPVINSLREIPRKKFETFPREVLELLVSPKIQINKSSTHYVTEVSSEGSSTVEESTEEESSDEGDF